MLEFRRAGIVTLTAAAALAATAAPAAADSAVCEIDGPATVAYEDAETMIFDRGYAHVRSEGDIRCAGTMGGMLLSTSPVPYSLSGQVNMFEGCSLAQGGTLRLDARIPALVAISADPRPLTADLSPSGWDGAGSIAGIGGFEENGLDIRGTVLQTAGWCESGMLHMRLTFSDGNSRPNRTSDAAQAPSAAAPPSAPAAKPATKTRRASRKRCAKKKTKRTSSRRCSKRTSRKR